MTQPKEMTYQDKQDVLAKLDWEGGFDYIIGGSRFEEYTDPEFRKLVDAYVSATKALEDFLGPYEPQEEDEDYDSEE